MNDTYMTAIERGEIRWGNLREIYLLESSILFRIENRAWKGKRKKRKVKRECQL